MGGCAEVGQYNGDKHGGKSVYKEPDKVVGVNGESRCY